MITVTEAYNIQMILCHKERDFGDYGYSQGHYNPKDTKFDMLPRYEAIPTKNPSPGIADMTWVDNEDKVMVIKEDASGTVEVRLYRDEDLFNQHVSKIKEIEGVE